MAGDAALLRAGTEHRRRRDRYGSCSIITIPTLRYDATSPDGLERVPLPGPTHLTSPPWQRSHGTGGGGRGDDMSAI
jgi:hypothetical protein